jgi:DNA-binding beta-propeller fold protein YncE
MTDAGSDTMLVPSGSARRAARRPGRRAGVLLAGMALVAACGVAVAGRGETSPVLRTVTVGGDPERSLVIDDQTSRAFVFNRNDFPNTVSVLDTRTGALVRTVSVGSAFVKMAVDRPTGHVFLSSGGDATISMLDARSGSVLRTVTDSDDSTRDIAVDERTNQVFVGHRDSSTVTVLDGRTGSILRHLSVCVGPFAVAVSERTGHLFAKCNDGTTDMLDARTGRVLHRTANGGAWCRAYVDELTNRVFETEGPAVTDVLDAQTGAHLTALPAITPFDCFDDLAVDNRSGRIYVGLGGANPGDNTAINSSVVVVLDGRTAAVLHRFPVSTNPLALAVDSLTGRILVGSVGALDSNGVPTGNGMVSVLDGTTGRILRTLQVGFNPSDIVVDGPARRALVVSSFTDMNGNQSAIPWRPREGWWPQVLRRIKQVVCCLPFKAPAPPAPTTNGTVTTIDLTRL